MKILVKCAGVFLFVLLTFFLSATTFATEVTHEYGPLEWSFQGKPVPETHWSPWLPIVQTGVRFKLGFLLSDGTITIKTPIKFTFRYDPDAARSGQDFVIGIKAEPTAANYNTFQSAFGISFPNKIQIGFVGVSGVPIDLPWFDLPYDFWELIGKIPDVGDTVASAVSNIGVNTSTQGALPLGKTEAYHNERDLISFELTEGSVEDLAPDVLGKIPESVRTNAVRLIKIANYCSDSEALEKLQEYVEMALEGLYDAPSLTLKGDPYFKVEGVRLRANVRVAIPGGKGSGLYTLYFEQPGQFKTITFRDITPFITPTDKLTVDVQDVAYEFRLTQGLAASVKISVLPIPLDTVEKVVTYTTAVKDTSTDSFKIEVPIQQSDALVQSLRTNAGCTSVSVNWASPSVPVKGTVKAYNGTTLVATVIENAFKTAHNVIVPNLSQGTTYRFTVDVLTQAGQSLPGGERTATTASGACPERVERTTCNALTLSNPQAVAGPDYIDFSWTTNQLASTEVMFSPSPDLSLNYVMAVKKVGDVVTQGWVTREGPRQFETNHGIRVAGLEPNTKYYYNLRSWTFTNNDETNNPQDSVGYTGNITTLQGVPPTTVKVRVRSPSEGNRSVPDVPVILTKNTDPDFHLSVSSGSTGVSQDVILDKGTTYTLTAQANACYESGTAEVAVPITAQGALPEAVIDVNKTASRKGFVLLDANHGIAGALVSGKNSQGSPISTTTTANGSWSFDSGLNPGSYTFTVSKDGYRTTTANATVNSCGRFIGLPVTLVPRTYTLNIVVKNQANQPVKNASVLIKEGGTTIATLTTDNQGKATKAGTLNDDNEHVFTIAVTPPVATTPANILPTEDFVTVTSAATNNVTVTCPKDTKAPVASQITITPVLPRGFQVSFKLDDEKGKALVEYQDPQGQIKKTTLKEGISSPGSGISDHTVSVQSSTMKPGTYRIKIRTKDKWNNEGESEVKEFQISGPTTTQTGGTSGSSSSGTSAQQSGQGKTTLKFLNKPATVYVNKEFSLKMAVRDTKSKPVAADGTLNWGDGTKDQTAGDIPLKHVYTKAGQFQLEASATLKDTSGAYTPPQPIVAAITVAVLPPKLTLSKGTLSGVTYGYKFTIKGEEGSYPIRTWTLTFGDGKNETGEGGFNKVINHAYAAPGDYKVELSVTDTGGAVTKKSLAFKILAKQSTTN